MRTTNIAILIDKLEWVRAQAEASEGSAGTGQSGRLTVNPTITEPEIAAFEEKHRIELPADYRAFLSRVTNGGPGPSHYGLLPLKEAFRESAKTIYALDEPFVPPESTDELVDFEAPGMLVIGYSGCAFYEGLVVSGPEAGSVWAYVEVHPGWVPMDDPTGQLVDNDGRPFGRSDDYDAWYNALLLPANRGLRMSFSRWYEQWLDDQLAQGTKVETVQKT